MWIFLIRISTATMFVICISGQIDDVFGMNNSPHRYADNVATKSKYRQERLLFQTNILDYLWDMTSSIGGAISIPTAESSEAFLGKRCRCKCGQANQRNARLLGGTDLAPFEFPWLVNIRVKTIGSVAGTLINDRYVLTAAVAMKRVTPFDVKVVIGLHDICHTDTTSTIFSVSAIILHTEFVSKSRQNDLALVRLSETVAFGELVSPICLPSAGNRLYSPASTSYDNLVSIVATWIKEGENIRNPAQTISRTSCFPRKIGLPVLDVSTCSESAARTQGCLGVVGSPSVLCAHDAGSGVMLHRGKNSYVMIGVLSDRQHCGRLAFSEANALEHVLDYSLPMFTRVINHLAWIKNSTKDACYCNRS